MHKLRVVFSKNTTDQNCNKLISFLGFKAIKGDEKFLGNPMFLTNNKTHDFSFVKQKVMSCLERWKARLLSQVGR